MKSSKMPAFSRIGLVKSSAWGQRARRVRPCQLADPLLARGQRRYWHAIGLFAVRHVVFLPAFLWPRGHAAPSPPIGVEAEAAADDENGGLMHPRVVSLLAAANADLISLGATPKEGRFVCPLCLKSLPAKMASQGHYPAAAVPSTQRRVELLCTRCNSFLGTAYESDAKLFLGGLSKVTFSAPGAGTVKGIVESRRSERGGNLRMVNPGLGKQFEKMRARATTRDVISVRMHNFDDRSAKRALLAWSLLEWFHFAGYRYAASPGAALARELLFRPQLVAPTALWFGWGEMKPPLPRPEPIAFARISDATTSLIDAEEVVSIGVRWGAGICVLPFANDIAGRGWARASELVKAGARLHAWPLRDVLRNVIGGGLHADLHIRDAEKALDAWVTLALDPAEAQALVDDVHPLRLEPSSKPLPPKGGTEHTFDVVSDGRVP